MNALITCVNYDDMLAITLPRNLHHFERVVVVTTAEDHATELLADSCEQVYCHVTDAFYRMVEDPVQRARDAANPRIAELKQFYAQRAGTATFNKGLAIEEGLDVLGRTGWIMLLDADVILPDRLNFGPRGQEVDCLYGPYRRLCETPETFAANLDWQTLSYGPEKTQFPDEFAGYCHVFHAQTPYLSKPWYPVNWRAEGADSEFYRYWPVGKRRRPAFEVLHLGPLRVNWRGRISPRWKVQ